MDYSVKTEIEGNLSMLAHIHYYEGYVPTQSNSVGSADTKVFAADLVREEHLLPDMPVSASLEKP